MMFVAYTKSAQIQSTYSALEIRDRDILASSTLLARKILSTLSLSYVHPIELLVWQVIIIPQLMLVRRCIFGHITDGYVLSRKFWFVIKLQENISTVHLKIVVPRHWRFWRTSKDTQSGHLWHICKGINRRNAATKFNMNMTIILWVITTFIRNNPSVISVDIRIFV